MSARNRKPSAEATHLPLCFPQDVGAIAVDTNIYKGYGFRVRSQPLAGLPQVKALGIKWLVPEFWELELKRHMSENFQKVAPMRRELAAVREWGDKAQLEHADKLA